MTTVRHETVHYTVEEMAAKEARDIAAKAKKQKTQLAILLATAAVAVFGCIACLTVGIFAPTPAAMPTATAIATLTIMPMPAIEPIEPVLREMYFCGFDRCQDSGEYGQLTFETGINVWEGPDQNRGSVHHQAKHWEKALVVEEKRVYSGPGGLWFRLQGGIWTNDLWLTEEKCTSSNLADYSFADCLMGEY